ncbi:threonine aldolase family protein [Streptomyces ureilyticus]|uniref:Low specificity L-threonine aldolase n=1 Tax=Streptomyces ureilyticus TaxID=1775131 RepID=A0ABX0DZ69_9ACTN|nr:threonine aldolase family protein [Streptomyces ureilyticus]NGO45819.1 low specificity L-threonine aldolase [Streptomyces ureilyticus]
MPAPTQIDMRSDTLSLLTPEMRKAMAEAEVGDDLYGGDPTTGRLEQHCAELFGKEAALFTTSGTLSNQLALRVHTAPGDEIITDTKYHINFYESAASAGLAGVALNTVDSPDGVLTPELLRFALQRKKRAPQCSAPALVCLENTVNFHSGRVVSLDSLRALRHDTLTAGLATHIDGARLANASVASGSSLAEFADTADTVSMCFAKGLAAPFGSILVGPADLIEKAAAHRMSYGGGMHQSGVVAAAALYALQHNVERMTEDHHHARLLCKLLSDHPAFGVEPDTVQTNILVVDVSSTGLSAAAFVRAAADKGVLLAEWTATSFRAVTRLGLDETAIRTVAERLLALADQVKGSAAA